jgi:energy-coupling factor transporter ATP-binding protein EcfA2
MKREIRVEVSGREGCGKTTFINALKRILLSEGIGFFEIIDGIATTIPRDKDTVIERVKKFCGPIVIQEVET